MKKHNLLSILSEFGIKPSKKLGQNFLLDENLLNFIIKIANVSPQDHILEVGPGLGALTKKLVETGAQVTAVEFDNRLAEYLQKTITAYNFKLIETDACKLNYNSVCSDKFEWRIIANLPYSVTTPLLAKFSEMNTPPIDMLFLLQKETAERFAAKPCSKEYGGITVKLQSLYEVNLVRTVPPDVFFPKPEVMSAIVGFTRKENFPNKDEIRKLDKVLTAAFAHRRKKVLRNLISAFPRANIEKIFMDNDINVNSRAEHLSIETFLLLTQKIYA